MISKPRGRVGSVWRVKELHALGTFNVFVIVADHVSLTDTYQIRWLDSPLGAETDIVSENGLMYWYERIV